MSERTFRDLLIVIESTRYDVFNEERTPNIDYFLGEAVKAHTHGSWTRPSIVSMLSGYLPTSELGQIYRPSGVMLGNSVFRKNVPAFFVNGNAWVEDMAPRNYHESKYFERHSGGEMVRRVLDIMRLHDEFFIMLFLVESHGPYDLPGEEKEEVKAFSEMVKAYNQGEDNCAPEVARRRSMRSVEYLDSLIKPILDMPDRVVFTSDHGELFGERHKIGHDPSFPFHIKLVEVPLIIKELV